MFILLQSMQVCLKDGYCFRDQVNKNKIWFVSWESVCEIVIIFINYKLINLLIIFIF